MPFVSVFRRKVIRLGCALANPYRGEAVLVHRVFLCCKHEIRLEETHTDAHGRKAVCMFIVPVCRDTKVAGDYTHAETHTHTHTYITYIIISSIHAILADSPTEDTQRHTPERD